MFGAVPVFPWGARATRKGSPGARGACRERGALGGRGFTRGVQWLAPVYPASAPRACPRPPRFPPRPGRPLPRHTRSLARAPHGFLRVRSGSLSSFRARLFPPGGSLSFVPGRMSFVPGWVSFVPGRFFRPSVPFLSSRGGCLSYLRSGRVFCVVSLCVRVSRAALPP